jgi:N-acetyl-gamma-glutamyl-phosphate reductase
MTLLTSSRAQLSSIPVAILGPTGYTGLELLELLMQHPGMHAEYLASARDKQPRIDEEFPRLSGRLGKNQQGQDVAQCRPIDHDAIAKSCKLAFLCLPHEAAMHHARPLLDRGVKSVDLSAAYRLKDAKIYAEYYGHEHTDAAGLSEAVYGLPELAREHIRTSRLVANPGCYPTAAGLALSALLKAKLIEPAGIIVNAASGASGAGREAKPNLTLVEAGDNFSAYGVGTHRHQPEINQTLGLSTGTNGVLFVPHLLPVERGILETMYATPAAHADVSDASLHRALMQAYGDEPFIRIRTQPPTLRDVQQTNMVHIYAKLAHGRVIVVATIDNLVKGASGQAIQNANLMLGLPETLGLMKH